MLSCQAPGPRKSAGTDVHDSQHLRPHLELSPGMAFESLRMQQRQVSRRRNHA